MSSAIYCEDHFSEFREYQKSNLKTQVKTRKRTENFNKTPTPFELEFVKPFKTLNKRKIKNHQFLSNFEISISQSFFFSSLPQQQIPQSFPSIPLNTNILQLKK
jgi:hypothetical protein